MIWIRRNNLRFKITKPSWISIISLVMAHVSLAGDLTALSTCNSIVDFQILKAFKVNMHPPSCSWNYWSHLAPSNFWLG
jgi:hypothetical protein